MIARDVTARTGSSDHNPDGLPEWDLSDLYDGPESVALERDLNWAEGEAKAFQQAYEGTLASLSGDQLGAAIERYEALDEVLSRVMSFAYLHYAGDVSDGQRGRFLQAMQEKVTRITTPLIFFTLEINRIDAGAIEQKREGTKLGRYSAWLRDTRAFRDHQLSDELERYLHDESVAKGQAWVRLFDETMAELRFPLGDQQLTNAEILNRLSDKDPATRKEAAHSLGTVLKDNGRLFAHITNTLAKLGQVEKDWRGYARPDGPRNLSNQVEDEVVDALVTTVRTAYPRLSHRYYALKARWMGQDQLNYWDRNAPLPEDDDREIPWAEAVATVERAYASFSDSFADVGRRFFHNRWIDVPTRPGKAPGAFSHPTVPSAHPYILLNYQGKRRDVLTLAHELGHGVHQVLAGEQGHLQANTPLTLAETASVFGEMLTFQSLLAQESDPAKRRVMLAGKIEDMLNTVVRQISFYTFEWEVHTRRREAELSLDDLGQIWLDIGRESLGPSVTFDDLYRMYWAYIPHFIHAPFYVYAYAFGDCLVNALYAVYQDSHPGFVDKYIDMLKAGGVKRHDELLAPFGLDARDPGFWEKGIGVIESMIDQLEQDMV